MIQNIAFLSEQKGMFDYLQDVRFKLNWNWPVATIKTIGLLSECAEIYVQR